MTDQKEVVCKIVRGYLSEEHPESLTEFDSTFSSLYDALQRQELNPAETNSTHQTEDVSFDGSAGDTAIVAMACVVGYQILKAILRDSAKRDLPKVLDELESKLSKLTGRPKLVSSIRRRVEGIIQEL